MASRVQAPRAWGVALFAACALAPGRPVEAAPAIESPPAAAATPASAEAPVAEAPATEAPAAEAPAAPRRRAQPRPVEKPEPEAIRPRLDVRFDFEAVDRFLGFVARGSVTDEELDDWARLAGNTELLRQGRLERTLTARILKDAARAAVEGRAFEAPPTLDRLEAGDWSTLRRIVASVKRDQGTLAFSASSALEAYLPERASLPPMLVRFHVGGSWDGRTTDAVYINLTVFQARGLESLPGLDALLVHELFHLAQANLLPATEDYGSRQSALYTLLLRMEQEGIARHLEYLRLRERAAGSDMDRTNLARYEDGLRRAPEHAGLLVRFQEALEARRMDEVRQIASEGFLGGGPLYAVGHAMAGTIEDRLGASGLAATVVEGPLSFARAYLASSEGQAPLLPAGMIAGMTEVERGYGRTPIQASRLRREGLGLMLKDKVEEATSVLKEAARLDPSDAISSYNLACAWALLGRERKAMRWLESAFERGFTDYKHAANDEDLRSLRDRPEFEALLRSGGLDYRREKAEADPAP